MRIVNTKSLVDVVNEMCREEPILSIPEVGLLLEEIGTFPEIDVSNFDRDTRYKLEIGKYSMPKRDLCVIYARRFIAALAFNKLIPDSVPYVRRDAAFAFDKASKASHTILGLVEYKEWIPWNIRILLNRSRAIEIFMELGDTKSAYYSCVYVLDSALSAERALRVLNQEEELPYNWTLERLRERIESAAVMASTLREASKATGEIVKIHDSLKADIRYI